MTCERSEDGAHEMPAEGNRCVRCRKPFPELNPIGVTGKAVPSRARNVVAFMPPDLLAPVFRKRP